MKKMSMNASANVLSHATGAGYRYTRLIGTGGIGSGMLFQLKDEHTLGRNESRLGVLTDSRDFCKLHIICHYPAVLLGGGGFAVYPIGKVGKDAEGFALLAQLEDTGMSIAHVNIAEAARTLFSVCFQYPDLSGGNITTSNSASGLVSALDIGHALQELPPGEGELVLAAPEVPIEARIALLAAGRARGSFTVASVLAAEAEAFGRLGGYGLTDLLAVNREEAHRIAGLEEACEDGGTIAKRCYNVLKTEQPTIRLIMTDGEDGCYSCEGDRIIHTPSLQVAAVSSAGAGDALLGGVISGLCCGLPFMKDHSADAIFGETPLSSAVELGVLLAALSVTSPHSIHPNADVRLLRSIASENDLALGDAFRRMLQLEEESEDGV
ncbi:carbohydrate kinase family protein [Paenibacillus sp. OV219]|uniref:carbohydrate kinase family protein n=1 Tax=Paenibacillus sp. OV219 TaxID=1884377 RepID=UPI0008AC85AE|nr:PfkB family carbohydrate kinase [Paenibacillus sp. OV219]SEN87865.1 Sugar or nucleoside kinase, ribokinase family [Paenibacillus sp. OV219]